LNIVVSTLLSPSETIPYYLSRLGINGVSTLLSPSETVISILRVLNMEYVSTLLSPSETIGLKFFDAPRIESFHTIKSF